LVGKLQFDAKPTVRMSNKLLSQHADPLMVFFWEKFANHIVR